MLIKVTDLETYRDHFLKLLNYPKPLRDQLILEFPVLNAFRTTEVATVTVEDIDLEHGDIKVLDSMKHEKIKVPLDPNIAKHLKEYLKRSSFTSGFIFRPGPKAGRRTTKHLTDTAIDYIWGKWCRAAGISYMSARYGRAYFALDWYLIQRKNIIALKQILRTSFKDLERYLPKYRYEDLKGEFQRGLKH